jgi:DNA-binding NtrC family response regulator
MKPKLLVVDDDHSVRESLKKLLETEHYEPLLSLLNERHSAPLRLSSALNAVLSTLPVVGKQLTTVET